MYCVTGAAEAITANLAAVLATVETLIDDLARGAPREWAISVCAARLAKLPELAN